MIKIFLSILFFALCSTPALAGYSYVRSITVQSSQISGGANLTQFPILVCGNGASPCNASIAGLNQIGAGAHVQNANGYDIIFTTDPGCSNKLTWEMEKYVASTGEFEAWVTNTSTALSYSANTTFYMCYGNSAISTFQSTASSVWDSNYKGVWHLPNGVTLTANDSTTNGNNGTLVNSPTASAGQIDGAATFVSASSQEITIPAISSLNGASQAVLSAWIKRTASSNDVGVGEDSGADTNRFDIVAYSDGNLYAAPSGSGVYGSVANNNTSWHKIDQVFDGTQSGNSNRLLLYIDGNLQTLTFNGSVPATVSSNTTFYIGRFLVNGHYTDGSIDEVRLTTGATRSAGWIATEYNNQNAPSSFYTMGGESTSITPGSYPGLVGWWQFDEGSGTTTTDSSGNGNGGTLINSPSWVAGKMGDALSFSSSSSQYVNVGTGAQPTTNDFSVSFWENSSISSDGSNPFWVFISNRQSNSAFSGFLITQRFSSATGTIRFQLNNASTSWDSQGTGGYNGSKNVSDGNWHHVTLVVSRTNNLASVYVDGKIDISNANISAVTGSLSSTAAINIARDAAYCSTDSTACSFTGTMDDVRIYNRALSAGEVYELFEQGGQTHMGTEF